MPVSLNPSYRNNRQTFYTEKASDTLSVGTVIQVLKSDQNSFEHNFVPTNVPNNGGSTKYGVITGDGQVEINPENQYPGYLYCDGAEYNISDYPALFAAIGNLYGGTPAVGITPDTIWQNWPGTLGTFKVPDFKAKRLVGNGPVYGQGTVSVGESDLGVGPQTIGGKWYLDEAGQKARFTLGNVTTTGYELVTDTIPADIVGTQTVTVNLEEKRLNGPPQHSHFLLHSEASQDVSQPRKGSGDFYTRGYKNTKGKVSNFAAIGGIAKSHRHILSKKAFTDTTIATYDTYNFAGGDSGSGTIKEPGFYYASGGAGAGSFVSQTGVAPPVFKKFVGTSLIGGRVTVIAGTPLFSFTETIYSNPGSYTFSMPAAGWDVLNIYVVGGCGSGAVSDTAGNAGQSSSVTIAGGLLSATSTGGGGGGAASANSGGGGGAAGTTSSSGILINATAQAVLPAGSTVATSDGSNATAGIGSTTYIAQISGWTPSNGATLPSGTFTVGQGGVTAAGSGNQKVGSAGSYKFTSSQPTTGPTTYTSSTTVTVGWSPTQAKLRSLSWTLRGAQGGDAQLTATGGPGHILGLTYNDTAAAAFGNGSGFTLTTGTRGSVNAGGVNPIGQGSGGPGGSPGGGSFAAGGGSATVLLLNSQIIAGAGGGGGGGGRTLEGIAGRAGNSSNQSIDATSGNLFGGAGSPGGNGGCNGGGGGGGGGGVDSNASQAGGGDGGSAGANSTQSGAGARGMSAYKTSFFNSPTTDSTSHLGAGSATLTYQVEASFYSPPGGGGGQAKLITVSIPKGAAETVGQSTFSAVSVSVGLGGAGFSTGGGSASAGSNGEVKVETGVITGYQGGQTIISVGDIISSASDGIQIYSSGLGTGTNGGFKLPTTQVPIIEMEPISGGINATATAIVANEVVNGATLVNGGSGYTSGVNVRFLGGAGSGTAATTTKNATGTITGITIAPGSSTPYTKYVKFGGNELQRFIILQPQNCTTVKRFTVKAARGNNINGGERPNNGDELKIYFNTDGTNTFPQSGYLGPLVPIPTDAEVTANYDGTGTGNEATRWYSYSVLLPTTAQVDGVKFKIVQERSAASAANDNAGDTDHFGICDFIYENKAVTELVFVPTEGKISTAGDLLSYTIDGDPAAQYTSGMAANDVTFTLSSSIPLLPSATIDPDINVVLLEPYFLVKHLIKAF